MSTISDLFSKSVRTVREEGWASLARKARANLQTARAAARAKPIGGTYMYLEPRVNRVVSPNDQIYRSLERDKASENYFTGGLDNLGRIDQIFRRHTGRTLGDARSVADYACHYGRLLRCLRAAFSDVPLYACGIDQEAVDFCTKQFGARPLLTPWAVETIAVEPEQDLVCCLSLLTHTRREFFPRVLELWNRMLRPGGVLLFTFLGEDYPAQWLAGKMHAYGQADRPTIERTIREFSQHEHAFYAQTARYGGVNDYGIGFLRTSLVREEIEGHPGLQLLEILPGRSNGFMQDVAVARKVSA